MISLQYSSSSLFRLLFLSNYYLGLTRNRFLSQSVTAAMDDKNIEDGCQTGANKRKQESQGDQVTKKNDSSIKQEPLCSKGSFIKPEDLTEEQKLVIASVKTSCTDPQEIEKAISLRYKARLSCRLSEDLNDTDYYIENGLRKVYPYPYIYQCYAKHRWVGKRLIDVIRQEFRALTSDQIRNKMKAKRYFVNGRTVDVDYRLKRNDFFCSMAHRHELPVLATPIKIIHEDQNFIVIDKPPSMPIHPCGRYRHNSILSVMKKDYNYSDLHVIHRLDKLVSGVLIFSRNPQSASILEKQISTRNVEKEYVCRVEGEFPEEEITVNKGLTTLSKKIGITIVDDVQGKVSKTVFKRLNYNGVSSSVLCKPLTGRMHQIRVHLQYLGHPIVNDNIYNSKAFGETKGKDGVYNKSLDQLVEDIIDEHKGTKWIIPDFSGESCEDPEQTTGCSDNKSRTNPESLSGKDKEVTMKALSHYYTESSLQDLQKKYKFDKTKMLKDPDCVECEVEYFDPPLSALFLYLHALSYKGKDWSYTSDMPNWANADWVD